MHVPDGMLPGEICIAGYAGTAALTWFCVKKAGCEFDDPAKLVSRASVMAAAFFVVSWIHIPLPPVSVHPVLAGLIGILLGWLSFPAILVGLFFQAAMFGHGGFSTLGVNALSMGGAALLAWMVYRMFKGKPREKTILVAGSLAGFTGVLLSVALTGSILILTIPGHINSTAETSSILAMAAAYIPLALAEGLFTGMAARFIYKIKPDMLM